MASVLWVWVSVLCVFASVEGVVYHNVQSNVFPVYATDLDGQAQQRCEKSKVTVVDCVPLGYKANGADCDATQFCQSNSFDYGLVQSEEECTFDPIPYRWDGLGHWSYEMAVGCEACPISPNGMCSMQCPCAQGQGQCQTDMDCAATLHCQQADNGNSTCQGMGPPTPPPPPPCNNPTLQTPPMKSATTPSGIVADSGEYEPFNAGWNAFDQNNSTQWLSSEDVSPAFVSYEWTDGSVRYIKEYDILFNNGGLTTRAPKDWTFEGYDTMTSEWVVLDTRNGETNWKSGQTRNYVVANPASFAKVRLHVTQDNDSRQPIVVVSIGGLFLEGCNQ